MRIFLSLFVAVFMFKEPPPVFASDTSKTEQLHELPPEKLDAIRLIGRNVLQAKEKAKAEPAADEGHVIQLRATLDKLLAAETMSIQPGTIELDNKLPTSAKSAHQHKDDAKEAERKAARTQAWDTVAKLRQDGNLLNPKAKVLAKHEESSGGFPIGQQRGRLFEQWANQLEAMLADSNTNRVAQLVDLRSRISEGKHSVVMPRKEKTPTIQAMPWVAPKTSVQKIHRKH